MRYQDAASFRQALERRLKERASGDGARLARYRKQVTFDRLLARLVAVAPGRWVLKGGFALDLRLSQRARATKDVDLDWCDPEDELLDALLDAANRDVGDYFTFRIEHAGLPTDRLGGSRRFRVLATLAGREFDAFPLDIAFRNEINERVDSLTTPDLLVFAGVAPVPVPAIRLERHVAEKLHAYTRTYEGDRPSSRTKDLVDLVLITELADLDAAALRETLETTFATRGTHPMPVDLPPPPMDWSVPFGELARAVGIPTNLASAHATARCLLQPILSGDVPAGTWDIHKREWTRH